MEPAFDGDACWVIVKAAGQDIDVREFSFSNMFCAPKLFFLNGVRFAVLEGRPDCEPAQLTVPVSIMLTSRFRPYWQCVALAAPN